MGSGSGEFVRKVSKILRLVGLASARAEVRSVKVGDLAGEGIDSGIFSVEGLGVLSFELLFEESVLLDEVEVGLKASWLLELIVHLHQKSLLLDGV